MDLFNLVQKITEAYDAEQILGVTDVLEGDTNEISDDECEDHQWDQKNTQ